MGRRGWKDRGPVLLAILGVLALLGLGLALFHPALLRRVTQPVFTMPGAPEDVTLIFFQPGAGEVRERRVKISAQAPLLARVKKAVELLWEKPSSDSEPTLWPAPVRFNSAYLRPSGLLILDLARSPQYNQVSDAYAELRLVESVVRTLTKNFPEVRQVKFLINGQEEETLAGHLDITRPFGERTTRR